MIVKDDKSVHFVSTRYKELKTKLLNKRSRCETKFTELLLNSGFYFIREKCDYKIGNRWSYYDFFIPSLRLYIEIDGEEHLLPKQKMIDQQKTHQVVCRLNRLIRYTNAEVLDMTEVSLDDFFLQVYDRIRKKKVKTLNLFKQGIIDSAAYEWVATNQVFGHDIFFKSYFLHNAEVNAIYSFKNLGDLRIATTMDVKSIKALLTRTTDNNAQKFILSTTLRDCQERASSRFGCTVDRIIDWGFPYFTVERNGKVMASHHVFNKIVGDETLRHENFDEYVQSKIRYYSKKRPNMIVVPNYERKTISLKNN